VRWLKSEAEEGMSTFLAGVCLITLWASSSYSE
jgi:hypothetical protein